MSDSARLKFKTSPFGRKKARMVMDYCRLQWREYPGFWFTWFVAHGDDDDVVEAYRRIEETQ